MKPGDNLKGLITQIKQSLTKGDEEMRARNEAIKQRDDAENKASLCLEEAERHYKSVGKMLAELQDLMPEGNVWKKYVVEQCGISYRRVAKLMQIYSGKTTLKEMRQRKKERMRKVRAKKGAPHKKRGAPRGDIKSQVNAFSKEVADFGQDYLFRFVDWFEKQELNEEAQGALSQTIFLVAEELNHLANALRMGTVKDFTQRIRTGINPGD